MDFLDFDDADMADFFELLPLGLQVVLCKFYESSLVVDKRDLLFGFAPKLAGVFWGNVSISIEESVWVFVVFYIYN